MPDASMKIGARGFDFSRRSAVMGILNVTPDSFSDGGRFDTFDTAVTHANAMAAQGADLIDIGGESTRPGSDSVSVDQELSRVIPVIEKLKAEIDIPISIDTTKAAVAKAALAAGAVMVNDISGMTFDPDMMATVSRAGVPVCIMHTADNPKVMQQTYRYEDVVEDIRAYFVERIRAAADGGIAKERLILDPGIGFGKSVAHNLQLIRELERFTELGCPVLIGASRKSFIGALLDVEVDDRLEGSLAAASAAILNGAAIVRVHDVKETVRVRDLCDAILGRRPLE